MNAAISGSAVLATLPAPWPEDLRARIHATVASHPDHKVVVLDDDPTGTQTVHDVPVLTTWEVDTLRAELARPGRCFYILTNSRSLSPDAARELNREIARNLKGAVASAPPNSAGAPHGGRDAAAPFTVVSRSDSTLRGHFPLETDVLAEELGPFDATILIPYFEAGGRYTIDDVHYVAESDRLVPAAQTPFAQDAAFGYRSSNLREWVEEKTGGRVRATQVASISLRTLRVGGPEAVTTELRALRSGSFAVVNAASLRDLDVFVAGLLGAERAGKRFLFRTAAQFVAARLGLEQRPLLTSAQLSLPREAGGLIMVGSHVPKTTEQLAGLLRSSDLRAIELPVEALLNPARRDAAMAQALAGANAALADGRDVVVFTSRRLVTGLDAAESLRIGREVSDALVAVLRGISARPRYIVAKGGITSSDLATRGLGVKRAMVAGQILPGIPVWRLGPETKFSGLCYVVFPGNVGGTDALVNVQRILSSGEQVCRKS